MESVVFFRHRHEKEKHELASCFQSGKPLNPATKKKLILTQEYDLRPNVLKEMHSKKMYKLFDGKNVTDSFQKMLDENGGVLFTEKQRLYPLFLMVKKTGGFNVNFIDAYMIDGDQVVAEQIYMMNKDSVYIMMMSTKEGYRGRGIATRLLEQVEHITFDLLNLDKIGSGATADSRPIFEKRGYKVNRLKHPEVQGQGLTVEADVSLSREVYQNKEMGE